MEEDTVRQKNEGKIDKDRDRKKKREERERERERERCCLFNAPE